MRSWLIVTAVVLVSALIVTIRLVMRSSGPSLTGCFDSTGQVYVLFTDGSEAVDQSSSQCKGFALVASEFGFDANGLVCSQNTTILNPLDPFNSYISALFCNPNTIYSLTVRHPPVVLSSVPSALMTLQNLSSLSMDNAIAGSTVLSPLFAVLNSITYFMSLNLTSSVGVNSSTLLSGSIPELPKHMADPAGYFTFLYVANNNLNGSIPPSLSDSVGILDVSNNVNLTGPLPPSAALPYVNNGEWTQTWRCNFANTTVCVNSSWPYSPGCIRDIHAALPYCGTSVLAPIDPTDPLASTDNSGAIADTAMILKYVAAVIEVDNVQAQLGDARGEYELSDVNREVLDLPAYAPPAPDYSSNELVENDSRRTLNAESVFLVSTEGGDRRL
ncbi:hypothetical protein HDU84_008647 [Entophlyctis sp. JEL0112]|nr:hypothetical protein HDU84_008647 [Entophlyctis sp. JEL0112]